MYDIQRAIENMGNYVRWGMPSVKKKDAETAISAMQELQQYRQIGTLEECREAREKRQALPPRKTTIFEGKDAEELAAKKIPNYETYKCPKCNRTVVDRTAARSLYPDGFIKHKYCDKCGQGIDWSKEK